MASSPEVPVPGPDWMQVLERIEQSLAQALRQVSAPPDAPASATSADERESSWRQALERLEERLSLLQRGAQQAGQRAAAADAVLEAGAAGLEQWLAAAEASRRKLAEGGERRV